MATNNAVNTSLSGQTGTGTFVGATSPSLTTPNIGAATATSLTFSPTTNGIVGTTTNNNASAGYVGEYISSISSSSIALTTTVPQDLTSIILSAGDWDVEGLATCTASASISYFGVWASSTSATYPGDQFVSSLFIPSIGLIGLATTRYRFSLAGTTTIYLSASSTFAAGTATVTGYNISARRVR